MKKPSKAQLSKELKELGVEYDKSSTQEQLQELLNKSMGFDSEESDILSLDKKEVIEPKKDKPSRACGSIPYNAGIASYKEQMKLQASKK